MPQAERKMLIRDRDLRHAVHSHGARPGTDLWRLLKELQERRDGTPQEDVQDN